MMKQILIILLSMLIGAAAIKFGCSHDRKIYVPILKAIDTPALKKFKDEFNIRHVSYEDITYPDLNMAPITKDNRSYIRDTLVKALNIADQKIEELTRVKATLELNLAATKKDVDETGAIATFYKTKYFNAVIRNDSLRVKYNAVLDIVNYQKKQVLFGRDKNFIDVSSPDTSLTINGIERYRKQIFLPKDKFIIGAETGLSTMQRYSNFSFGLKGTYNPDGIISPSLVVGFWNGVGVKTQPYIRVSADFNLIRF